MRPARWALWAAAVLVVVSVVAIEFLSVFGITLGLFYERLGFRALAGWAAPLGTLALTGVATWILALLLTRFERGDR